MRQIVREKTGFDGSMVVVAELIGPLQVKIPDAGRWRATFVDGVPTRPAQADRVPAAVRSIGDLFLFP